MGLLLKKLKTLFKGKKRINPQDRVKSRHCGGLPQLSFGA